jgi:hypothetical protein
VVRAWVVVLVLVTGLEGAQAGPDDEDDPGVSRAAPPPPEEPQPDPVPFTEEDPAYASEPPRAAPPSVVAKPDASPSSRLSPTQVRLRASYRTLRLAEVGDDGQALLRQRFHGVGLDIYPISSLFRVGLATQLAIEDGGGDWVATEGLVLGCQLRRRAFAAFLEGGAHAGVAQRSFWFPDRPMRTDSLTLLWAYSLDVGVDVRLFGSLLGTLSVGVQRTSYLYSSHEENAPLLALHDKAFALKLGIGY